MGNAPLTKTERGDFWEICEDRYQVRPVILTSQLRVALWHEPIGDPTIADGILDRLFPGQREPASASLRMTNLHEAEHFANNR